MGVNDGVMVGDALGERLGIKLGCALGCRDGDKEGTPVGERVRFSLVVWISLSFSCTFIASSICSSSVRVFLVKFRLRVNCISSSSLCTFRIPLTARLVPVAIKRMVIVSFMFALKREMQEELIQLTEELNVSEFLSLFIGEKCQKRKCPSQPIYFINCYTCLH